MLDSTVQVEEVEDAIREPNTSALFSHKLVPIDMSDLKIANDLRSNENEYLKKAHS